MSSENGNGPAGTGKEPEASVSQRGLGVSLLRDTFASLRHRNFRYFFAGQLISLIGTWTQNTAQGWLVYELTGSKMLLGVVAAVGSTPMMLFSILGGSVADRHSKRNIILVTQTGMMMFAFAFAVLVWTGQIRTWQIMVLAALGGLAMAFDMPARQSFMVEMTSREDLINAISLNSSIVNAARVLGPSVAGILMVRTGMAMCFFLNGLSYLAVIAGLRLMRLPQHVQPARTGSAWEHAWEGFVYVWQHRRMRNILVLFAIVGIFGWSYSILIPAFARDELRVGEGQYSLLLSANGVGALLGALTVASVGKLVDRRVLVFGGLGVFSAMLCGLALTRSYPLALAFMGIGGWGMLLFFSTTNTLLQTSASDAMRGRVMGIWALVFGGMTPVGGIEAGTLAHVAGLRPALMVGSAVCAVAALTMGSLSRRRTAD